MNVIQNKPFFECKVCTYCPLWITCTQKTNTRRRITFAFTCAKQKCPEHFEIIPPSTRHNHKHPSKSSRYDDHRYTRYPRRIFWVCPVSLFSFGGTVAISGNQKKIQIISQSEPWNRQRSLCVYRQQVWVVVKPHIRNKATTGVCGLSCDVTTMFSIPIWIYRNKSSENLHLAFEENLHFAVSVCGRKT